MRRLAFVVLLLVYSAFAKDKKSEPGIVVLWPNESVPTLRLTFERFNQQASYNGEISLASNVLVENLTGKFIPRASLTVYLLDKNQVRVGNGALNVNELEAGQKAKIAFQVFATGLPASLNLAARNDVSGIPTSLKTVPLKIISVPPGATLRVDGRDAGVTPIGVNLTVGGHTLEFTKDGYAPGSAPVDVKADEVAGGSITFELGGLTHDVVELRSGKSLQGDVISLSMTAVVLRTDGKEQAYDRNEVRKIYLVQRERAEPAAAPSPANP